MDIPSDWNWLPEFSFPGSFCHIKGHSIVTFNYMQDQFYLGNWTPGCKQQLLIHDLGLSVEHYISNTEF